MTRIIHSHARCDGPMYFECDGHSDYRNPETANNDVCVAVSAICGMLVRYIISKGHEPKICKDGHVKIELEESSLQINEVFKAAMMEFEQLAKEYPKYVKVY